MKVLPLSALLTELQLWDNAEENKPHHFMSSCSLDITVFMEWSYCGLVFYLGGLYTGFPRISKTKISFKGINPKPQLPYALENCLDEKHALFLLCKREE